MPSTTAASRAFSSGRMTPRNFFCFGEQGQRQRAFDFSHAAIESEFAGDEEIFVAIAP